VSQIVVVVRDVVSFEESHRRKSSVVGGGCVTLTVSRYLIVRKVRVKQTVCTKV